VCWEFIKYAALGPIGLILFALKAFGVDTTAIFDKIKEVGSAIWNVIKNAATTALNIIMAPIKAIQKAIDTVISGIKSAITWASKIPVIGGIFGGSHSAAASSAGLAGRYWATATGTPSAAGLGAGRASASASAGPGGVTVNVSGALDPVAVARQIRALLVAQDRRQGGTAL
jgi:hypothetical protein